MRHSIRAALRNDVALLEGQRLAGGDANLRFDEVDAGDHLGDGVLDLNAGVDFDKVKIVLRIDDELDRAGVGVANASISRTAASHIASRFSRGRRGGSRPLFRPHRASRGGTQSFAAAPCPW